jgi:hypothetical protein
MLKQQPFTVGQKVGKLKIESIEHRGILMIAICKCECGQVVLISKDQFNDRSKLSCLNCEAGDKLKLLPNDIAVCTKHSLQVPFNQQVIVVEKVGNERVSTYRVEYQGKYFLIPPSGLQSLGTNFYGRTRRSKKVKN